MLVRAEVLTKYAAAAADGERRRVVDLLFDERPWVLEYVVLGGEASEGASRLQVAAVESVDVKGEVVAVSPPRPAGSAPPNEIAFAEIAGREGHVDEGRLGHAPGFRVEAGDEWYLGQVADVLLDSETLDVRYLEIVGPGSWWPGVPKLLPPSFVVEMDRVQRRLRLRVAQRSILTAPAYKKNKPIEREYEGRLFEHYGERPYWQEVSGRACVRIPAEVACRRV